MRSRTLGVSLSLLALACTPTPTPTPTDQGVVEQAPQAPKQAAPATPEAKPPGAPAKPKLDEAIVLRKQLLALLNEGRALTKKGDYAGGMAKYGEALKIDASDVSVLGELGWAAFKAGELELAHRTTVQALKFVREDPKKRGMLLYNLGRVEEDREKISEALDHYRASLAARPNDTVAARLAALEAKAQNMALAGSASGELVSDGLATLARDLPDLAAACKWIEAERCEDYTMDVDEPCSCEPKLLATPGADASWGLLQLGQEGVNMQVAQFPAVETDKGWTVFSEVSYVYNPGMFGIYEELSLQPSTVEPVLGKGTQLVIKYSKRRHDSDMGVNEIEEESYDAMVVCARDQTGAYCSWALLTAYEYSRGILFEGEDQAMSDEPIEHELVPATGFTAKVEFVDGKLVVAWTEVKNGFDRESELWGTVAWILPPGEHPLTQLLGMPG